MEPWEELHAEGYCCQLLGEFGQARQLYGQALALKPDYAFAQSGLAQLTMMQTCFREGREGFEARFAARSADDGMDWRELPVPRWRGEPIAGKHLHLWVEQGFGDVVMYAGFLPHLLAQKPKRITLGMFPKMVSLMTRSFPDIRVEPLEEALNHSLASTILELFPKIEMLAKQTDTAVDLAPMRKDYERALRIGQFDYASPMGDVLVHCLPGFVPAHHQPSHLIPDPARVAAMRETPAGLGQGRRIGISWHTSNTKSGMVRNVPLAEWLPVLSVPGCHFMSLQHHVRQEDVQRFCAEHGCKINPPGFDPVQDTEGLAALIASLDEVISIDNSNAHLAGALGVPATLLLPKGCDFRWPVCEGTDTLWYKSVSVLRQAEAGKWQPVMERMALTLAGGRGEKHGPRS